MATAIWRYIVRPIAVGGMMVGTCYTLFRMRKNLIAGLAKAIHELRQAAVDQKTVGRTERYMSSKTVFGLIGVTFLVMCVLYIYISGIIGGGIAAAIVMLIVGFFFATVSGYLVGVIGSSNNPISGLTLSTLVIAALLMVSLGVSRNQRRGGGAGRGRGGLRVVGGGGRTAAGFQGRLHSRRHSAHHPDRRTDRGSGGQLCDVLPAAVAA